MKNLLIPLLLSFIISLQSPAQEKIPQFVRTVTYEAVQKDTTWTTGVITNRIHFVKFNRKGYKVIENILNPDATPYSKYIYFYDDQNRVIEKAEYSGNRHQWSVMGYEYDQKNRIVSIIEKGLDRKEKHITTVRYDDRDRIVQRIGECGKDTRHHLRYYLCRRQRTIQENRYPLQWRAIYQ